ncbi:MAG: type I-E CRISPR-associated protein Cse1/CasA, partial [Caldilineaceae bacterium]|nr:type I-E CRISPR-associated protein Cse1/CasA [Caldilineaceae bacterium]
AIFARMNMGGETTSWPPLTFNWLTTLVQHELIDSHVVYRCKAMGLGKNKGKVEYLREERFPFPLRYLIDETLREQLRDALQETDRVARILHGSLCRVGMYLFQESADNYKWERQRINMQQDGVQRNEISKFVEEAVIGRWERGQLKAPGWIAHTDAEMYYWSNLDEPFQRLIAQLATEEPSTTVRWWRSQVRAAANGAFAKAKEYAHESERAFHAIVEGQRYLEFQLNKMFGKEEKA